MARGLKFRILVEEGLYYPYSENKGADQLRGYREADLRLCFRVCKNHDKAHFSVAVQSGSRGTLSQSHNTGFSLTSFMNPITS